MSFHFCHLRIKDWLVYGDQIELALPGFSEGRNLVVINGQNGFGKTSLLQALDFVFRGKLSKAELIEKWNERARERREGSLEVAIEFVHANRTCKIVRGADFRPSGDTTVCTPRVSLYMDGQVVEDQIEDKIEKILPRDCLDFIFFDGAEISKYAQKHEASGVRDSIEKMLGIPAVRNLRDDMSALIRQLEREREEILIANGDSKRLLQEIDDLKTEQGNYVGRRKETHEKKTAHERTLHQLSEEALGFEAIEPERQNLEGKKRRLAELNERKDGIDRSIRSAISNAPLYILAEPISQVVEELRAKLTPSDRREKQRARAMVIRDILEEAQCICGQNIDGLRKKLESESARLNELLGGVRPRESSEWLVDLQSILHAIRHSEIKGEALINQRAALITQIEEVETDIGRLLQQLEGHDEVEVREIYQQKGSVKQQIKESADAIESLDRNLSRVTKDLELKQRELDRIGSSDDRARGITKVLEECRRVYEAVVDLVDRLVEEKRSSIEREATEIFRKITNKPQEYDKLHVKGNYALEVVRKNGTVVENEKLSAGEKEVVAYSFIAGLNLSSVDPAPFVMDTPFGHLDSGHRRGLLQSLPKLQVQAFLLATDRDLPASERDAIDSFIAREFTLRRDQANAVTEIEEA